MLLLFFYYSFIYCWIVKDSYSIQLINSNKLISFFALQIFWGSLVSAVAYFLSLELATQWIFSRFARFWSLSYFKILGTGLLFHEPVHFIVIFQYLIKRRTLFLRHSVHIFFSHQYEKGAITIMAINLEPQKDLYFNLTGNMTTLMGEQFLLEPDGVITSK